MDIEFPSAPPSNVDQLNLFVSRNFESLVTLAFRRVAELKYDALNNKELYIRGCNMKSLNGAKERNGVFDILKINLRQEIEDEWLDLINYEAALQIAVHFNL